MTMNALRKLLGLLSWLLCGLSAGCGGTAEPLPDLTQGAPEAGRAAAPPQEPAPADSKPIDLATAIRLAAGSHYDILEARARVAEAEGRAFSADAALLPSVGLVGLVGHTSGQKQASFGNLGEVDFNTVNAFGTVRLTANIGESVYRRLQAHRRVDAVGDFERATLQRTLVSVSLGYLTLVEADSIVRHHEQFAEETRGLVRLAEARETQGLGTSLDTERARTQLASAEQRLVVARNDRQRHSKTLASALRLDPRVDLVPMDKNLAPARLIDPAVPLPRWLEQASLGRPETRALYSAKLAAEAEASATRWSLWGPQIDAGARVGGAGKSFGTLEDQEGWNVAFGWTFALGGLGQIESADARVEQASLSLDRFRNTLIAVVAAAHRDLILSQERLGPAQRETDAAERALKIANANFQGGRLSETDLILTQQAADQARLRRLSAVARFNQAQIRLLSEAGGASVESLSAGVFGTPK